MLHLILLTPSLSPYTLPTFQILFVTGNFDGCPSFEIPTLFIGYKYTPTFQDFPHNSSLRIWFSRSYQNETDERRLKENTNKMQKAWFYNEYGSIDVLKFGEFPLPKPGPGQILIKIRAAALNPVDFKKREGLFRSADSDFPGEEGFSIAHQLMRKAVSVSGASVHWSEKPEMRKQRKMGHITVVGPSMDIVKSRIKSIIDGGSQAEIFGNKSTWYPGSSTKTSRRDWAVRSGNGISHVGIIMGSDSDLPVMKAAAEVLESFQVPYEITIVSAHRTPERMVVYAQQAHERGIKVIIAGAGGAAHLPGMVAAMTPLPVIGVPVKASSLDGIDSLLSIVQMPRGVPVATVAIQNATNAGLLAIRILGSTDSNLQERIIQYQIDMKETVLKKAEKLETGGWSAYLS